MADPRISVILPTWDRATLLPRAISSVLAQTETDFELIVVDDGSTDGTPELLAAVSDERVRCQRLEGNVGAAAARNAGIAQARGEFLAFHDSDDEWAPEYLSRHICALEESPGVDVTYSDMERVHEDGSRSEYRVPEIVAGRWIDPERDCYQVYGIGIQATVFRKTCFARRPWFDESLRCFEDLELFSRLSRVHRFRVIREPLARYYENEGVSTNLREHLRARQRLLFRWAPHLWWRHPGFVLREFAKVHKGLWELGRARS